MSLSIQEVFTAVFGGPGRLFDSEIVWSGAQITARAITFEALQSGIPSCFQCGSRLFFARATLAKAVPKFCPGAAILSWRGQKSGASVPWWCATMVILRQSYSLQALAATNSVTGQCTSHYRTIQEVLQQFSVRPGRLFDSEIVWFGAQITARTITFGALPSRITSCFQCGRAGIFRRATLAKAVPKFCPVAAILSWRGQKSGASVPWSCATMVILRQSYSLQGALGDRFANSLQLTGRG